MTTKRIVHHIHTWSTDMYQLRIPQTIISILGIKFIQAFRDVILKNLYLSDKPQRRFINRKWNVSWEELVLYWILTANKIANLTQHVNSIQLFLFIHHINAVSLIGNKMYICCCWFDILLYWPLPTNVSVLWFITYRRTHIKSFCHNSFPLLIHLQTNHRSKI